MAATMERPKIGNRLLSYGSGDGARAVLRGAYKAGIRDIYVFDASSEKLERLERDLNTSMVTETRNLLDIQHTFTPRSSDFAKIVVDNAAAGSRAFKETKGVQMTTTIFTALIMGLPYQFIFSTSPDKPKDQRKVEMLLNVLATVSRPSSNSQVRNAAPSFALVEPAYRKHAEQHVQAVLEKESKGLEITESLSQVNVNGQAYPLILVPTKHLAKSSEALVHKTMPQVPHHQFNLGDSFYILEFTPNQLAIHSAKVTRRGIIPLFRVPRTFRSRRQNNQGGQAGSSMKPFAIAAGAAAGAALGSAIYTAMFTAVMVTD